MPKTITIRLPDKYLKDLEKIKEFETKNYHFVGNTSDVIRLLIYQRIYEIEQNNR